MQTQAVIQQRVGEVGPRMAEDGGGWGEGDRKALQQLAQFPGNRCSFFSPPFSLHNVAITVSKTRSTFASVRPPKSTSTKSTGAIREVGRGCEVTGAAAAAAAIRPTPAAALRRLAVAHFPQMTWDKATNLAAVARGGACAASGCGLIQRTYSSNGPRWGRGARQGSCIGAVHVTIKEEELERGGGGGRRLTTELGANA